MNIIEKIRAEIEGWLMEYAEDSQFELGERNGYKRLLSFLSDLEKEERSKRVRTLEEEFDGYNPIVVTLDKYVLEGIGVSRHGKVIIKIQRKED